MDKNELDVDNPLKQAEALPVQEISLLPKGCETPEGAMRVKRAMDAFEATHANVANQLTEIWRRIRYSANLKDVLDPEEIKEIDELIEDRAEKQNEFLKAVCGVK